MSAAGLPPHQMRRSGRARVLTAKAQEHVQGETMTFGEEREEDEDDAMEGVLMAVADSVGSTSDSNECTAAPAVTAYIDKTGTRLLALGPTARKARQSEIIRNAETKRLKKAVDTLTGLTRRLLKEVTTRDRN